MVRDPHDPGFGICVKGGKDAGKRMFICRFDALSMAHAAHFCIRKVYMFLPRSSNFFSIIEKSA